MPRSRRKASPQRVAAAILLAILTHGVVAGIILLSGAFEQLPLGHIEQLAMIDRPAPEAEEPLQIEQLMTQLDRPEEQTREEAERKKEEEKTKAEGQVVDIARPAIEQRPDEARFLAEYDSTVQKQQRGKAGREQAGAEQPTVAAAQPQPPSQAQKAAKAAPAVPGPQDPRARQPGLAMRSPAQAQVEPSGSMEELAPDGSAPRRLPGEQALPQGGGRPGGRPSEARPNLLPSLDALSKVIGQGAGSPDYLKDIDDGDSTALSAKKWKFASFFNRVKSAVSDQWHPDTVYLRHDPSGNIYGVKDRVTMLRVHLKPDGRVASLEVLKASGVDFLDDEATSAFKRAQPFPNPPAQLVESDGQIHFNFAFIFELSGKTSFKVFRY